MLLPVWSRSVSSVSVGVAFTYRGSNGLTELTLLLHTSEPIRTLRLDNQRHDAAKSARDFANNCRRYFAFADQINARLAQIRVDNFD